MRGRGAARSADLLRRFNLPAAVVGRREVAQTASPGNQWLSGASFKDTLLNRVTVLLGAKDEGMEDILAQQRIAELEAQVVALDARIASLGRELDAANGRNAALQGQLEQSKSEATGLQARVAGWKRRFAARQPRSSGCAPCSPTDAPGRVAKPSMVDKVDKLAHHPTLPPYANRTRPISMIVVHHTDTPKTTTVRDHRGVPRLRRAQGRAG